MKSAVIDRFEAEIMALPLIEQTQVVEYFACKSRKKSAVERNLFRLQMEAMAADPQIQQQIREIREEFACTDTDGLELA